jgi:hypothetical protein
VGRLFVLHLLRELLVVLLEAVANALLRGHPLKHAAVDAAALARRDGLGGEVVDARGEAVLDEAAESLVSLSQFPLIRFVCFVLPPWIALLCVFGRGRRVWLVKNVRP